MISRPSRRLDGTIDSLTLSRDTLKIATRVLRSGDTTLIAETEFVGLDLDVVLGRIESMRGQIEEIAILNLWIVFEQFIVQHVTDSTSVTSGPKTTSLALTLKQKLDESVERWNIDTILALFKELFGEDETTRIKQIHAYRNWIAHRNQRRRPPPAIVDPIFARSILGNAMDKVE